MKRRSIGAVAVGLLAAAALERVGGAGDDPCRSAGGPGCGGDRRVECDHRTHAGRERPADLPVDPVLRVHGAGDVRRRGHDRRRLRAVVAAAPRACPCLPGGGRGNRRLRGAGPLLPELGRRTDRRLRGGAGRNPQRRRQGPRDPRRRRRRRRSDRPPPRGRHQRAVPPTPRRTAGARRVAAHPAGEPADGGGMARVHATPGAGLTHSDPTGRTAGAGQRPVRRRVRRSPRLRRADRSAFVLQRTPEQTATALFHTVSPRFQHLDAIRDQITGRDLDIVDAARALAVFNASLADVAIACWRDKYDSSSGGR